MTVRSNIPKTYVTWLAKLLSGDNSCMFFAWFSKIKGDFDFAEWNVRHTLHLHEMADRLEDQNWFETRAKDRAPS